MIRSEMPESEAFCSRTVCKDGVVQFTVQCIGSGDDLDPFLVDFGRWDWVGVSGSLTGTFFHCAIGLFKDVKKIRDLALPTTS